MPSNIEERKLLFRLFYAHRAFEDARAACTELLQTYMTCSDTIYKSLTTAIHIHYGRPFTMSHGAGKLTDEIVPSEFRATHQRLLQLRHQFFAHSDTQRLDAHEWGRAHQVRFILGATIKTSNIATSGVNERPDYYERVSGLLDVLIQKIHYHIRKTFQKH